MIIVFTCNVDTWAISTTFDGYTWHFVNPNKVPKDLRALRHNLWLRARNSGPAL